MENQRALPFLPQEPVLGSASEKRLMMSWWDREIHIWRLSKPSHLPTENEDLEVEHAAQNRKLVAKILIKGEANITSATLGADGTLLAVSTASDIRTFQLRPRKPEDGDGVKISKLSVANGFSTGAKLVQFSPDGKWLCIIRHDNRIHLTRISTSGTTPSASSTNTTISIHNQLSKLERIDRKIEKRILLGGLGTYDRSIGKVTFSSDSRILAVSDLAGYIDTFVLSGEEDLTQPARSADSDAASLSDSSSESDSDGDDEEGKKPRLIFGQYWTRNPSASSLPKLPSTPVVLSFRPATTSSPKALTNGVQPHATRHNPHPMSHSVPTSQTTEDRLLVLTATSEIFEFEVLKGGLSPWSRRNPTSQFPSEFRQIRDQARGCIWDVTSSKERVWLYGVGWLWMFELSRDLPDPNPEEAAPKQQPNGVNGTNGVAAGTEERASKKRKRKRNGKDEASGAGSTIPDEKLGTGISRTMQRNIHEEVDENLPLALSHPSRHEEDDEDAMDPDDDVNALEQLRRGDSIGDKDAKEEEEYKGRHYWNTFKYRPILGMCVIGEGSEENGPEVAIVERPIWEADLPPRYYGDQEWERSGV
jgi:U3 small nucleolar RNA-associated protein 4